MASQQYNTLDNTLLLGSRGKCITTYTFGKGSERDWEWSEVGREKEQKGIRNFLI